MSSRVEYSKKKQYPFFVMDPKNFLKAPSALKYTKFEGEARAEKTRFFGQNFPKSAKKTTFWPVSFLKLCLRRKKNGQTREFLVLWESSKNKFGRPKKKVDKIFKLFLKFRPTPPRENPRSAPGSECFFYSDHFYKFFCFLGGSIHWFAYFLSDALTTLVCLPR